MIRGRKGTKQEVRVDVPVVRSGVQLAVAVRSENVLSRSERRHWRGDFTEEEPWQARVRQSGDRVEIRWLA